jgi:hypothetical protein
MASDEFLLLKPPAAPVKKTRSKVRIKVRSRFDRAGGAVPGEMVIDNETGFVTVREKGCHKAYSITLAEVCEYIARRGLMGVR